MKILMAGDIVGQPGRTIFANVVTRLRADKQVDVVVVNAENAAQGRGVTAAIAEELFAAGADAITLGDHTWDRKEFSTEIESLDRIVRPMNFAPGKNFDTSMSLGPCIVVGELDAEDVDFETLVNGEQRQQGNTKEMVFSFGDYLEYLSRDMTLYPGDIIVSGTPAGSVADSTPMAEDGSQPDEPFLQIGDVVEVNSPQIGALRARIRAKNPE